jgi:hypothetical protein
MNQGTGALLMRIAPMGDQTLEKEQCRNLVRIYEIPLSIVTVAWPRLSVSTRWYRYQDLTTGPGVHHHLCALAYLSIAWLGNVHGLSAPSGWRRSVAAEPGLCSRIIKSRALRGGR